MEFQKLLDLIISSNDFKIDENEEKTELLNYFWTAIRDGKEENLEEIKNYFKKYNKAELFEKIKNSAKEVNKEYYDFEYFRNNEISDMNKIYLINSIFTDAILVNKGTVENYSIPGVNQETLASMCYWIARVVYFCVNYNYDGNKLVDTLYDYYHIEKKLLEDLRELYNDNLLMLKINNLTMLLNSDN